MALLDFSMVTSAAATYYVETRRKSRCMHHAALYQNVQHWANAHTKRYTPDSVRDEMMDYYDRERKQMHHSSGSARIYRTYESGNMNDGGSRGNAEQDGDADKGKDEEDNEHHDEGEVPVDLVI